MGKNIILSVCLAVLFTCTANGQDKLLSTEFPLKISGYVGVVHPIATLQSGVIKMNFKDAYTVGFPAGINIQKSKNIGFSFEIAPFITANDGISKVQFVLIHPGVFFPLNNGWTLTNRLAFETNGRYGITPSVSKVLVRGNNVISLTVPFPLRFGNGLPVSFGTGVLFTVSI